MIDATEIVPGLAVGGKPPTGLAVAAAGWQALVLCAIQHQPPDDAYPGVQIVRCPIRDREFELLYRDREQAVLDAVAAVVRLHGEGARVLVTCLAGQNRSALVAALAIVRLLRVPGEEAVRLVRAARNAALWAAGFEPGNHVLHNPAFEARALRAAAP